MLLLIVRTDYFPNIRHKQHCIS